MSECEYQRSAPLFTFHQSKQLHVNVILSTLCLAEDERFREGCNHLRGLRFIPSGHQVAPNEDQGAASALQQEGMQSKATLYLTFRHLSPPGLQAPDHWYEWKLECEGYSRE